MSYTPTNWQTGDTITAEKLNKLENGVAGGGGGAFPITDTYDSDEETHTLNKTWQEIFTAFTSGYTCYVIVENVGGLSGTTDYNLVLCIESASESYSVISSDGSIYVADATSGYPTKSD